MYKIKPHTQIAFEDFDQPMGLTMNPENRWIKKSQMIPWTTLEKEYAKNFLNKKGNVAKPLRMALGALLIQKEYGYSDEETVLQLQENPYLQFFIGLPGYKDEKPFDASTMVYFRKRLDEVTLMAINEKILEAYLSEQSRENEISKSEDSDDDDSNVGTLILDATCAPQQIKYPTDTELLNDARTHAESIIDTICEENKWRKPRIYRKKARKVYLFVVRRKKKTRKWLRPKLRQLLNFVKRDIQVITDYLTEGCCLNEIHAVWRKTIQKIYNQQQYMYDNRTHSVSDRIVSFHQPWIHPIVRGKAKAATEFGTKLDLSLDNGFARLEKTSFDSYNESEVLVTAVCRYYNRHGHFPKRVLADKIYRNRNNINYCKERGIRLSGPALGRPKKNEIRNKQIDAKDNRDRIEVERSFSQLKRCFGMGLILTKRQDTILASIALSVIALNLSKLMADFFRPFFEWLTKDSVFMSQFEKSTL